MTTEYGLTARAEIQDIDGKRFVVVTGDQSYDLQGRKLTETRITYTLDASGNIIPDAVELYVFDPESGNIRETRILGLSRAIEAIEAADINSDRYRAEITIQQSIQDALGNRLDGTGAVVYIVDEPDNPESQANSVQYSQVLQQSSSDPEQPPEIVDVINDIAVMNTNQLNVLRGDFLERRVGSVVMATQSVLGAEAFDGAVDSTIDALGQLFDVSDTLAQLGSFLGGQLAGDSVYAEIAVTTGLSTVLDAFGQGLEGLFDDGGFDVAAFKELDSDFFEGIQSAGVGAVSSYLVGELADAIGLAGDLDNITISAGGQALSAIANNFRIIRNLNNSLNAAQSVIDSGQATAEVLQQAQNTIANAQNSLRG